MSRKILQACAGVLVAIGVSACEMTKSEHPLGPTVAGPIPGVNITSPTPLEPAQGFRIRRRITAGHLDAVERRDDRGPSAELPVRGRDRRGVLQQGIQPRRHHARGERPHDAAAAECAGARAVVLLARARTGRREHRPVLGGRVFQRLHPGRARQADPAGTGRQRDGGVTAADVEIRERAAQRTGGADHLRDSAGRKRRVQPGRRHLGGRRDGRARRPWRCRCC